MYKEAKIRISNMQAVVSVTFLDSRTSACRRNFSRWQLGGGGICDQLNLMILPRGVLDGLLLFGHQMYSGGMQSKVAILVPFCRHEDHGAGRTASRERADS